MGRRKDPAAQCSAGEPDLTAQNVAVGNADAFIRQGFTYNRLALNSKSFWLCLPSVGIIVQACTTMLRNLLSYPKGLN